MFELALLALAVFLFVKFPKAMLGLALAAGLGGFLLYDQLVRKPERDRQTLEEQVEIAVRYAPASCPSPDGTPRVLVTIRNTSPHTVRRVEWDFAAYAPGHSTNLVRYARPSSDLILQPGDSSSACHFLELEESSNPAALDYEAWNKSIQIQDP